MRELNISKFFVGCMILLIIFNIINTIKAFLNEIIEFIPVMGKFVTLPSKIITIIAIGMGYSINFMTYIRFRKIINKEGILALIALPFSGIVLSGSMEEEEE
jgi:hypothetical protein